MIKTTTTLFKTLQAKATTFMPFRTFAGNTFSSHLFTHWECFCLALTSFLILNLVHMKYTKEHEWIKYDDTTHVSEYITEKGL